MLNENLKALRKEKGFSQEELASKVHVVRQTVSKWEKGLSVPDAEMLVQIADIFEVPVSRLLGASTAAEDSESSNHDEIAEQLMKINEQLVIKNNRTRKIIKWLLIILVGIPLGFLILVMFTLFLFRMNTSSGSSVVTETDSEIVTTLQ